MRPWTGIVPEEEDKRYAAAGFAGLLHGRQEEAEEDADDGDHDEQFDERKAGLVVFGHGWAPCVKSR